MKIVFMEDLWMSNLIGQSLGRYHILEQLGEGGMAIVYKAYDTRLETDVAVKVIRTEKFTPEVLVRALKRFEREAKSLARLTHPNIVKVTDYGEHENHPYLVMPYLAGGNLKERIKQTGAIPWQEAARLLVPIAQALEFAHSQGMIHRDVKPSNILLTQSGQPMLTDFGVAKVVEEEATLDLTGTAAAVGTPEYMAPEQTGKNIDHRVDIYALGIVFYEMITGRRPFEADTPLAVIVKQASDPLPRPSQFMPGLPDVVEKVLIKVLAKKPEDRYQSMGEFAKVLEGLATAQQQATAKVPVKNVEAYFPAQGKPATVPQLQPFSQPDKRKIWRWMVGGAAVIVILGVGLSIGRTLLTQARQDSRSAILITQTVAVQPVSSTPTVAMQTNLATQTTTPGPLTLSFNQNFEDAGMTGFRMMSGAWSVVPENNTNKVLQVREVSTQNWPSIQFGPENFHNGIIQYRFNIIQMDSTNPSAGMEYIIFRVKGDWPGDSYTFQIQSLINFAELNYIPQNSDSWPSLGNKSINISPNRWYTIEIEVNGWRITVSLDGEWFMETEDSLQRSNSGCLGFQGSPTTTIWFDNVQVWEYAF
jgi:serine/threonine protein kinase